MKLFHLFSLLVCITLLLFCTSCGTKYETYEKKLVDKAKEYEISAVSSVMMDDGKLLWESNYGSDSKTDGVYCIGSISKSFVAVLSLLLEQEGKINLDDTIGKYLSNPTLQNKSTITLRNLLTMRSGIANYTNDFSKEDYFKEYSEDELIQMGISHSAFLEQGDFIYSNTNIIIAKLMIEKATGLSCETMIKEKILVPMNLVNTFFAEDKQTIYNRIISGYSNTNIDKRVEFTDTTTSWSSLACGMYSTSNDMAKWGDFLINSSLLSQESRKELFTFMNIGNEIDYGLCIMQKQIDKKPVIVLQGNVPGYSSVIYIIDDTVISVLCNLSNYTGRNMSYADEIGKAIMTLCLERIKIS